MFVDQQRGCLWSRQAGREEPWLRDLLTAGVGGCRGSAGPKPNTHSGWDSKQAQAAQLSSLIRSMSCDVCLGDAQKSLGWRGGLGMTAQGRGGARLLEEGSQAAPGQHSPRGLWSKDSSSRHSMQTVPQSPGNILLCSFCYHSLIGFVFL